MPAGGHRDGEKGDIMTAIIIKLLICIGGFLIGMTITSIFAKARKKGDEAKMETMRNCMKKQDDAIRKKQNRIDELEREARREKRKS